MNIENSASYEERVFDDLTIKKEIIQSSIFESCKFINCDFSGSEFIDCKFSDCEFRNTNLKAHDLDFSECDLSGADFFETDFTATRFNLSKLDGCNFKDAIGYSINPLENSIEGASFSLPEVLGLLSCFKIRIDDNE